MAIKESPDLVFTKFGKVAKIYSQAIVMPRAPLATDISVLGRDWIDTNADVAYKLTKLSGSPINATWTQTSQGANPVFTTITTTGAATIGTTLTVSGLGLGVVQSDATGLLSSSDGTDGQVLIASTGVAAPAWANLTAGGGINIVNAAGSITISNPGATGTTFGTDIGGPVSPTVGGLTNMTGGLNINTDGSVANVVTFNLDNSITLAGSVDSGTSITAGNDFTMLAGECTINADTDVAQAILLNTNGGTNETIELENIQGISTDSIILTATAGGVTLFSDMANVDAITLTANNAAGGITANYGTAGMLVTGTNGVFTVATGTGAISIGADAAQKAITIGNTTGTSSLTLDCGTGTANIAASATAHNTVVGSLTGASATTIRSGTGDLALTSTDDITVDSAGLLNLNSSAGNINIGSNADNFDINLGTAGARTITIGNVTGATGVAVNTGTGSFAVATTGTGDIILNSDDTVLIDGDGVVEINSSAGIIGIGNDADDFAVNVGVAGIRTVTVGSSTGASASVVDCGTGGASFGASANAHTTTIGSTNTTSDLLLQSGSGGTSLTSTGTIAADSTGGVINIGTGANAFAVNICTGAAVRDLTAGSTNTTSSTTLQAGTGGISLDAAGIVTMTPVTDTQAAAAVTINANAGVGTFTGLTTAAAASQVLTVTNSVCTINSAIICTIANKGANDAQCTVTRVVPAAGSFTVTYQNLGAAALNGDVILTFWIIA